MARTSTWSSLLPAVINTNRIKFACKNIDMEDSKGKTWGRVWYLVGNGKVKVPLFFLLFRTWSHGSCCCGGWLMLSVEDVALRFTHQVACTWPIGYFSWKCNLVRNRYYTKCKNSSTHRLFMIDDWWYAWVFRLFILFCIHVPLVWTLLSLLYVMVNKPILVAGVYNMYTCQKAQWHWSPPHGSDFGGLHAASSTWEHHP